MRHLKSNVYSVLPHVGSLFRYSHASLRRKQRTLAAILVCHQNWANEIAIRRVKTLCSLCGSDAPQFVMASERRQ